MKVKHFAHLLKGFFQNDLNAFEKGFHEGYSQTEFVHGDLKPVLEGKSKDPDEKAGQIAVGIFSMIKQDAGLMREFSESYESKERARRIQFHCLLSGRVTGRLVGMTENFFTNESPAVQRAILNRKDIILQDAKDTKDECAKSGLLVDWLFLKHLMNKIAYKKVRHNIIPEEMFHLIERVISTMYINATMYEGMI